MKKTLAVILALAMVFAMFANVAAFADETEEVSYEKAIDEIWANLEEQGKIGEIDGTPVAYITFSADMMGAPTEEELAADAGEEYVSATLDEDGNILFVLTKEQHLALYAEMADAIYLGMEEFTGEGFAIERIECSPDFTVYTVYLTTEEAGMSETFLTIAFAIFGQIGCMVSGLDAETTEILAYYYNVNNELVYEWSSAELFAE